MIESQNAQDLEAMRRILVVGDTGSGKTTQFLTLPGRKFAYLFDPAGKESLQGFDVDFVEMLPEQGDLDLAPSSIRKSGVKKVQAIKGHTWSPKLYNKWVEDYKARSFEGYDWLMIDSVTLLSHALMSAIYHLQEQINRDDERTDYRLAGDKLYSALWELASLPLGLYCTVHQDLRKDQNTAKTQQRMTLPGGARLTVPRLFGHIFICHSNAADGTYSVQTRPDREHPIVKTALRGLALYEDVTIKDWAQPETQGVGRLMKKDSKL